MRIGLFGGSFDPIHVGHVAPVREVLSGLDLDRVIYLPTARPPHKPDGAAAPAWARYAMVELALLHENGLVVSPFEMSAEIAYTVDTVEHFRRLGPADDLVLIVGGDSLAAIASWRRWRRIVETVELAALVRPGWEPETLLDELPDELRAAHAARRLHFVANAPVSVSSTELRRRLAAGEAVPPEILPPLVLDYVRKYGLYR